MSLSAAAARMAAAYCSGVASSDTSMRSQMEATSGSSGFRPAMDGADNLPSFRPISLTQSAASTPGPPPLVTSARRGPTGR